LLLLFPIYTEMVLVKWSCNCVVYLIAYLIVTNRQKFSKNEKH